VHERERLVIKRVDLRRPQGPQNSGHGRESTSIHGRLSRINCATWGGARCRSSERPHVRGRKPPCAAERRLATNLLSQTEIIIVPGAALVFVFTVRLGGITLTCLLVPLRLFRRFAFRIAEFEPLRPRLVTQLRRGQRARLQLRLLTQCRRQVVREVKPACRVTRRTPASGNSAREQRSGEYYLLKGIDRPPSS
jgi:hypothetical protein